MSKLSFREDWTVIPFMIVLLLRIIVSIADFIFLQEIRLQLNIWFFSGIVLLIPLVFFPCLSQKIVN